MNLMMCGVGEMFFDRSVGVVEKSEGVVGILGRAASLGHAVAATGLPAAEGCSTSVTGCQEASDRAFGGRFGGRQSLARPG